jgi:dihydrofolate reductase
MTLTLVVAMGANGVIGVDGGLPWRLPEDLAHFKQLTMGHPMVMGRTTFESIGRPLPGRTTIVLTRDPEWAPAGVPGHGRLNDTAGVPGHRRLDDTAGVEVASSLESALERAHQLDDEVFVVGGEQVYAQALATGLVDLLCVTRVAASPEGDTWFPTIDWERWREVGRVPHGNDRGDPSFDIVTYERA